LLSKFWFLIVIIISGCASVDKSYPGLILKDLSIICEISPGFVPQKSVYDRIDNTTFVMEKNSNKIHIFKDKEKINTIGGLGYSKYSFNKLSDISLSPDGNLLVLDSFDKVIKKFDKQGKYITEFNLDFLLKPQIFDISLDESLYIYDQGRKEIVSKRSTEAEESFSFGKFILTEPASLIVNEGIVQVYDIDVDKTFIFNLWGDLIQEYAGKVLLHKKQIYQLAGNFLIKFPEKEKYAFNILPWSSFYLKYNSIILNSENKILISEFIYEN
jgi:hypothetical protein